MSFRRGWTPNCRGTWSHSNANTHLRGLRHTKTKWSRTWLAHCIYDRKFKRTVLSRRTRGIETECEPNTELELTHIEVHPLDDRHRAIERAHFRFVCFLRIAKLYALLTG